MIKPLIEYVGFHSTGERREYVLRLHTGPDVREYTVGIALAAFASGTVRYQDGPEISFLKLHRELDACGQAPADVDFTVSEAELDAYREAHPTAKNRLSPPSAGRTAPAPSE